MGSIRFTPEQIEARRESRDAAFSRSVSDVARDIQREQREYNRQFIANLGRA